MNVIQHLGKLVKLCKWHTLIFRCPSCGHEADYAAEIVEGPQKGSTWNPAYWCEKCSTALHAKDKWLYGAAFGPLMASIPVHVVMNEHLGLVGAVHQAARTARE